MSALWTPQALLAATGGLLRRPFSATGVSIDSRTVRPGDLFIALVGEHGDGHAHVAAALARGAAGAMVHQLPDGVSDDAALLQVRDTFVGLHDLGRFGRARFQGRMVAVTGSVGKTTTKEMLRVILSAHGKAWAAEASHNNHWGVPLTLARLPEDAKFAVTEIGMNHAGEIAPLSRLARPHVAVVTSIASAHIGYLGSIEAIAAEKVQIEAGLEPWGTLLLPGDCAQYQQMACSVAAPTQRFGRGEAEHRLLKAEADAEGTDILASIAGREIGFRLPVPGLHMAMNAVAALAAASLVRADPAIGAEALRGFAPMRGRGARRRIVLPDGTADLLDESYNASAASVRATLAVLALIPAKRRIAVLGDMLELGNAGPAEHIGLASAVVENADLLFTCGPLMRGLHDAIPATHRGGHAADSTALAPLVAAALRDGDAVLVKGSLGSHMQTIVSAFPAEPLPHLRSDEPSKDPT
jgi:UDP-N-acetylmuramoyl-tripeptide--D-alanyl-D-alanine ligase